MSHEFHARGAARKTIRSLADNISTNYPIERERAVEIIREEFEKYE